MSLFVCDKCGCIENTALGRYYAKDVPGLWGEDNAGLALCSECAPLCYASGERTSYNHRWHGKFKKRQWDGKEEVINRKAKRNG